MTENKKKVLCLHGGRQTAEIFENQLAKIQTDLKDISEFHYIDAPFLLEKLQEDDDVCTRSWCSPEGDYTEADKAVEAAIKAIGPVQVLLGFSQGGAVACRYLARQALGEIEEGCRVRGMILAGTPDPRTFLKDDLLQRYQSAVGEGDFLGEVPSLHLVGKKDAVVPPEESIGLAKATGQNGELIEHEHAHSFPQQQFVRRALRNFLSFLDADPVQTEEDQAQREADLEMMSMMYDEAASCAQDGTVPLPLVDEGTLDSVGDPSIRRIVSHLRMRLHVPKHYPRVFPTVSVGAVGEEVHRTGVEKWKAALLAEADRYLSEECVVGDSVLLPLYLALTQWTQEHLPALLTALEDDGAPVEEEEERKQSAWDLEDEAARAENIAAATVDAERRLCAAQTETVDTEEVGGGGGKSNRTLVVGLIGKPSAGKSTFFNAITDPQSEADAARVAAFPFTTIEPNVGTGFGPVRCACGLLQRSQEGITTSFPACDAQYGHVYHRDGPHRRHPVIVKDVAGLVQGAYEGKGKGNQFLNDLCDADVLVHVVDGAAATEADGTACTPGEGSALKDIDWVRAEVHSWIYDNLRSKWFSITRQPIKLRSMFTGYRSSPTFVDRVLQMVGVNLDPVQLSKTIRQWGPVELHTLVAVYVRLRFPMVVALNKADIPSAFTPVYEQLRRQYPTERFVPMSARTECALLSLRQRGVVRYQSGDKEYHLQPAEERARLQQSWSKEEEKDCAAKVKQVEQFFETHVLPTTGVQEVLAEALRLCPVTFVYPVTQLPVIPSLLRCLSLRKGCTAEELFNVMSHQKWIDGKYVRCEAVSLSEERVGAVVNLRKVDTLQGPLC
ncbi:hypothetical protein AGDE_08983 [Angomonas deanei]|uniref:OBG-type G domain-containing protein n=1 Tax=Angomonas deanei TaxID=59799 RepID=A0A7G2CD27_9TRYP|nr:hypothetical protein AGDE_08983 [Angomonas deanei]CAD2216032.1 Serine hydrolase (FSH1)/Alpha/beta hydrolase family/50S ribosome-binding GTPase/GTPase of unknown function C-terminal, putative [Angomonas deanei]|eukprot:EPY31575.1 hypothetical protein AGDE_08983 [Angomonas deanei]